MTQTYPRSETEKYLLGAMILDSDTVDRLLSILQIDDFQSQAHRLIYRALLRLRNLHQPIDFISLTDYLRSVDQLECAGGSAYIMSLVHGIPTTAGIEQKAWDFVMGREACPAPAASPLYTLRLNLSSTDDETRLQQIRPLLIDPRTGWSLTFDGQTHTIRSAEQNLDTGELLVWLGSIWVKPEEREEVRDRLIEKGWEVIGD